MKLRLWREVVTRVTIQLNCAGTERNGMYETALPNWGGGGVGLTLSIHLANGRAEIRH